MSQNGMNVAARAEHGAGNAGHIPSHIAPRNLLHPAISQRDYDKRDYDTGATVPRNATQKNAATDGGIGFTTELFRLFRDKVGVGCNVSGYRVADYHETDRADAIRAQMPRYNQMPRYSAFDFTPFS